MRFKRNDPPRVYEAGFEIKRHISDCGKIELMDDEQITFITESGCELDVARKSFGFYAAPSLNGRLQTFNLRAVLTKNRVDRYFLLLVEKGKEEDFFQYIHEEQMEVVCWMDSSEALKKLETSIRGLCDET